jgi:hypothetical protein
MRWVTEGKERACGNDNNTALFTRRRDARLVVKWVGSAS